MSRRLNTDSSSDDSISDDSINEGYSIATEHESYIEKIAAAQTFINIIKSRITLMESKIKHEHASQHASPQKDLDLTDISSLCKETFNELLSAIHNLNMIDSEFKFLILGTIGQPLLHEQGNLPPDLHQLSIQQISLHGDTFFEETGEATLEFAKASVELKKISDTRKEVETEMDKLQLQVLHLVAAIDERKGKEEVKEYKFPAEYAAKLAKIRINKAIVNCILAKFDVDYEKYPELFEIKKKSRIPFN